MTKRLVLIATLALLAVVSPAAQAAPLKGFDAAPLLHIRFETYTIAGEYIDTTVTIHASGASDWTERRLVGPARILRTVASPAELGALNRALQDGRVGIERGGCGSPAPDGPVEYEITWYSKGTRYNSFRVGGNPEGCSARTRNLAHAIADFLTYVAGNPDKQVFPRN